MISDHNIIHGSTLFTRGRLRGGTALSAEEITNAFVRMYAHLQQVQTALAAEQATTELHQNINRGGESGGIIGAIKRGQMKEISTNKYTNMQVSGYCKSWAKDMTDDLLWHAKFIKELIEDHGPEVIVRRDRQVLRGAHGDQGFPGRRV